MSQEETKVITPTLRNFIPLAEAIIYGIVVVLVALIVSDMVKYKVDKTFPSYDDSYAKAFEEAPMIDSPISGVIKFLETQKVYRDELVTGINLCAYTYEGNFWDGSGVLKQIVHDRSGQEVFILDSNGDEHFVFPYNIGIYNRNDGDIEPSTYNFTVVGNSDGCVVA